MNCPNCNTWNPDDKQVCWRCQAELPKPPAPKKKRPGGAFPLWTWVVLAAVFALTLLAQCYFFPLQIPGR